MDSKLGLQTITTLSELDSNKVRQICSLVSDLDIIDVPHLEQSKN